MATDRASPDTPGRRDSSGLRRFLFRTRLGWLFLALVGLRFLEAAGVDTRLGGVVIFGLSLYFLAFLFWGFRTLRTKLLWKIRRKLIISYLLIGFVPTALILFFFLLSAYLVFAQVSSYMLSTAVEKIEGDVACQADLTAADVLRARGPRGATLTDAEIRRVLGPSLSQLESAYPGAGVAYLEADGGRQVWTGSAPRSQAGPPLGETPPWARGGYRGLLHLGQENVVAAFSPAVATQPDSQILVTLPLAAAMQQIERETRLQVQQVTDTPTGQPASPEVKVFPTSEGGTFTLPWVAMLEARAWGAPETAIVVFFNFSPVDVLNVVATNTPGLGRAILISLGILAGLFLAIEILAIFVGLMLARSITGSVHALSQGTVHVRRGDFSYKIQARSRDQLGELAESFNLMTTSIQDLLRQSAEKERLQEELRIARQIQMSLLPKDQIRVPGLSIAALCLPATEVGGDYYDLIPLGERRLALLIADVSGKGASAALYMAELKGLVLSLSQIYDSPRKLLIEANKILAANLDSRSFITMAYAVLDMNEGKMTFARAGHNPILQLSADGEGARTRVLAPEGLGLALDRTGRFEQILAEESLALRAGDLFMFFTDGLSEAMNRDADLFGESRLREILERHSQLSLEDLREKIIDEIFTFAEGEDQQDDMTMVLVKVL